MRDIGCGRGVRWCGYDVSMAGRVGWPDGRLRALLIAHHNGLSLGRHQLGRLLEIDACRVRRLLADLRALGLRELISLLLLRPLRRIRPLRRRRKPLLLRRAFLRGCHCPAGGRTHCCRDLALLEEIGLAHVLHLPHASIRGGGHQSAAKAKARVSRVRM